MTTRERIKEGTGLALRAALAVTFAWACFHKIADPRDFALQVATYQILPLPLVNLQAIVLPWVELFAALLLALGLFTRPAALVTCGMNVMFIAAISMALAAHLHLQCGCFASSSAGEEMNAWLIVRDALLLLAGAYLTAAAPGRLSLDRVLEKRRRDGKTR
ncbi:MAG: DoxX family membrane protein [Deltaproteobacteria bacterium]|nr:DoxX family membrane protein [Deltaproteobacteria bacterium]